MSQPIVHIGFPVLPLRDIVVFPHVLVPLYVGRPKSLRAIEEAQKRDGRLLIVAQKDAQGEDPGPGQLYQVGTLSTIKQQAKLSDGNVKILIEGGERARIIDFISQDPYPLVSVEVFQSEKASSDLERHLMRTVLESFKSYLKVIGKPLDDLVGSLENMLHPDRLVDIIATQVPFKIKDRQEILELQDTVERMERLATLILSEIELIKIDRKIKGRVREQIEKSQKDYYLHEQLSAIHKELGDESDPREEAGELEQKLAKKDLPDYARARGTKEIRRLKTLGGHAAEAAVIRNYIDLLLELPWNATSEDQTNIDHAEKILNEDHYGLKEVKERILEFLAVRMRVEIHRSPVICFVGPPGVGKTSLASSIARALGRKFERISLGGLRDEAELRGHRRTYIAALPGKIISAIRKAGTSNPVILLDEIDKVGADFRGDPSSVLLEILDPEQNKHFSDHFLDIEYDLSKVLFIATANTVDTIAAPLRDRMELIRLSGYDEEEKLSIAKGFVVPRERKNHGLDDSSFSLEENSIRYIIRHYTREAGVRSLQREIAKVARKVVRKLEVPDAARSSEMISPDVVEKFLGVPKYRQSPRDKAHEIGLVTGLAWTSVGGEILAVEATVLPGKGKFQITGQLGSVMQESGKAALSYVRSKASLYGIDDGFFATRDIHVHIPEGAIPKDGPSAGITLATALLSAILKVPVRRDLGMTGEITLRGRVLPIGGLKEKLLAAQRAELKVILFPFENEPDIKQIDSELVSLMELIPVYHMDEVIERALIFPESSARLTRVESIVPYASPIIPTTSNPLSLVTNGGLVVENSPRH